MELIVSRNEFEFVVYMIHACANKWNRTPADVYKQLRMNKCITDYLIPFYDVLHTQGTAVVVSDIEQYSKFPESSK